MTDLATALVALIEPHAGQARLALRPLVRGRPLLLTAVMAGPGVMAGGRWVATGDAKATRIGDGLFGDPSGACPSRAPTGWNPAGRPAGTTGSPGEWRSWPRAGADVRRPRPRPHRGLRPGLGRAVAARVTDRVRGSITTTPG